jgi:hypothetical protein
MRHLALFALTITACGGSNAKPCTVEQTDTGATISCPDGSSADVADGASGSDGQDGSDGADGTDNHIAASHFCTGALEATSLFFVYQVAVMSSGDVFAYGSIKGVALEVGASTYYSAAQAGADLAAVFFASDNAGSANGGWWAIELNRDTGVTDIAYHDADVAAGLLTWTMLPAACVVNTY